jgi:hypothetical protein
MQGTRPAHFRLIRLEPGGLCQLACAKIETFSGGAVAQLGARLDGIEEVVGSNPIGSTKPFAFLLQ